MGLPDNFRDNFLFCSTMDIVQRFLTLVVATEGVSEEASEILRLYRQREAVRDDSQRDPLPKLAESRAA